MIRAILALAVGAGLMLAPSATAATSFQLGTGSHPDVDVDAGGTAHIVVDLPDEKLRYCQIPRGQTTCSVDKTLTPPSEATGRSSFVFVPSPNRVVIATRRCCGPEGVFVYESTDNGANFAGPTQRGTIDIEDAHWGPGNAISGIERSGFYQRMFLGGPSGSLLADLPAGFAVPTASSVAVSEGGRPLKVSADGDNTTFSRVKDSISNPNSKGNWSGPTAVTPAGGEPHLASGPQGLAMIYRVEGELHARKFDPAANGFDPHETLSTGDPIQADLTTDDTGRFTAIWQENAASDVRVASSPDGVAWTTRRVLRADSVFNTQVATAPDGEGFAVFDSNSEDGAITVTPLDPRTSVTGGGDGGGGSGGKPLSSTTVNGTTISFFGPTACIQKPRNIVLRVTSKRKRQLSPRRRVKIARVVFRMHKTKKTDRKKAFRKSFTTRRLKRGKRYKVGAVVRLAPVKKGAFKAKVKRLKGRFRMCS
jgi:hypothetical protein